MNKTSKAAAAIAFLNFFLSPAVHAGQYSSAKGLSMPGGPRLSGASRVPSLGAPTTLGIPASGVPGAVTPGAIKLPATVVPGAAASAVPAAVAPGQAAHETLQALSGEIAEGAKADPAGLEAQGALGEAFDGTEALKLEGAGSSAGNGGGSGNGGGRDTVAGDQGDLGKLYPRVVMILDTLSGPASEKLVKRVEALANQGVKIVFVTARPDKGENSADSVLVSKLKVRTANPVIVVSYNGARITARSSRSENPKPLVPDQQGFAPSVMEVFRKINAAVKAKFGLEEAVGEFGMPNVEAPQIYGVELPPAADVPGIVSYYNRMLKSAGYNYRVESKDGPDGKKYLFTQSTALKLNTNRIFKAVYAQYPELRESLTREQVLVLADSTKAANFLNSLTEDESVAGKRFFIHGVKDEESLETAIGAVLGDTALEKISVMRSQLRAYTDWLEARAKYGSARGGGGGGGGGFDSKRGRYYRDLGFYRGIIIYDIMGRLYHSMRKGQYADASPEAAEDLLVRMWYYPLSHGVRISPELEAARHSANWKAFHRGYLETAKVWLRNYYHRNFKDYPHGVSERVVGTLINLSRDSKNSITLQYAAPFTGRRYMVHLLPARAHLERDDQGNLLVAHVYRSGKEPYEEEFEDSIETNLLARAMLQGYADRRADGRWYVNDEPNPRVKVVFHYNTRDLSRIMMPEDVEANAADVTTLIEKMNADQEFLAHWQAQEEQNKKIAVGAAKRKAQRDARPKAKRALRAKKS